MTRFLADENVPRASILLLRQNGLDIRSIGEDAPGTPDARVLKDAHFVPATPDEPATVIRNLLDHDEIPIQGRLTVVTREGVRQRPLP